MGLLLLCSRLYGQAYVYKHIGPAAGLSEGFIYALSQDDRGFLWLGTGSGLQRYDGMRFRRFTQQEGMAEDFVTALKPVRGGMWIGHYQGGISWYDGIDFHKMRTPSAANTTVNSLATDTAGYLWASTQRSGIFRADTSGTVEQFGPELEDVLVNGMLMGPDMRLYLATDRGLWVYSLLSRTHKATFSRVEKRIPEETVTCLAQGADPAVIWIATATQGLYRMQFSPSGNLTFQKYDWTPWRDRGEIISISEMRSGELWLGTRPDGISKFIPAGGTLTERPPAPGSESIARENIRCSIADANELLWLGTNGNGLICLQQENISLLSLPQQEAGIRCQYTDPGGQLWLGTDKGLLHLPPLAARAQIQTYSLNNRQVLNGALPAAPPLPRDAVNVIRQDAAGNLWVGFENQGLWVLRARASRFERIAGLDEGILASVSDICTEADGDLWAATRGGTFLLSPDGHIRAHYTTQEGLPHNHVLQMLADGQRLILLTRTNELCFLENGKVSRLPVAVESEVPTLTSIYRDPAGTFWMTTEGNGIYRYDGKNFLNFSKTDGLFNDYCYQTFSDASGRLWVVHRGGFSYLNPGSRHFLQRDFGTLFPFEETFVYQVNTQNPEAISIGSGQGIIHFRNQKQDSLQGRAPVYITSWQVNDSDRVMMPDMLLEPGTYRIRFEFHSIAFNSQENIYYRYRLDGNDSEWSDPQTTDYASWQGLRDGTYTFLVQSSDAEGNWGEPVQFQFTILKPFWKRLWFQALAVLVLGLAIWALIRLRLYRLQRENVELERKVAARTQELLEEKEKVEQAYLEVEKLSIVASETDNAIYILDATGNLVWVNSAFERISGYTRESLTARIRPGEHFLSLSSNPEIMNLLHEVLEKKKSVSYESLLPTADGRTIWVLSTMTPVLDPQGHIRNIVVIDSNITDRKEAEARIQEMNQALEGQVAARTEELHEANKRLMEENKQHIRTAQRLRETNQELDTFIYRASHDIKGPLASLIGLVDIATREVQDPVALRYLPLMGRSANRLDSILVDLLEATQIKQSRIEYKRLDLNEMVQGILESIAGREDFQSVQVRLRIPEGFSLHSDPLLLRSILQNFIENAVKYQDHQKPERWVEVHAWRTEAGPWVSIRDNGVGIPDPVKPKVFEMFFRGHEQSKGSGLGLYIVKNALSRLQSKLEMESREGEGSEFRVFFNETPPVEDADAFRIPDALG